MSKLIKAEVISEKMSASDAFQIGWEEGVKYGNGYKQNHHCPYCEIKEAAKSKTLYEALDPIDGKCSSCGSWIDAGQHSVKVNGYSDIYKGAIRLIDQMVSEFNHILNYCDIDLKDYFEEEVKINMYATDIIDKLFVSYYGSTTKYNFANALNIKDYELEWKISKDEVDEE